MSEDETPLFQIILRRFKKVAGDPPAWHVTEQQIVKAVIRNWLAISRSLFLTIGVFSIIQLDPPNLAGVWLWITTKLPAYETHKAWYAAGVLIVMAVQAHWLRGLAMRTWRYCRKTTFAPVAAIIGVPIGCSKPNAVQGAELLSCWPCALIGGAIFFVSCASWLSTRSELTEDIEDRLQRNYFVEQLLGCFKNPQTKLRRIAVMGGWGTGKTVVLRLIRKALLKSDSPKFGVAMINPWVSPNIEGFHAMITRAFEEALGYRNYFQNPLAGSRWASFLTGLKFGGSTELSFDLQQLFRGGSSSKEDELVRRINHTLSASGRVCVILVDDMERAEHEVIRRVFPLIDVLRRIEHCFFVFAIDPSRVAGAFNEQSASGDQTKGYLDKVFDLQLNLPEARPKDLQTMCRHMIDPDETPKLYAAWDSIKSHLPTTPREAIHFMRDAIMRETLFLNRYGSEEHDFVGFYKIRLLAMEMPAIVERITIQARESIGQARYAATMMGLMGQDLGDQGRKSLDDAWNDVTHGISIPTSKAPRMKSLFEEVLTSKVDLSWACHHHMRLLTLNHQERLMLQRVWRGNAGTRSILKMIPMAAPGDPFDDPDQIASQLLTTEIDEYESIRSRLIGARSRLKAGELMRDALARAVNLLEHARYTASSGEDREFYPENVFKKWLDLMFQGMLPDSQENTSELRRREQECSVAFASLLNMHDAYHFARSTTRQIIGRESFYGQRNDLIPHIDAVKSCLQEKLYREFIGHIRSGQVARRSFLDALGVQFLTQVFGDLESWNPDSANLEPLRELENEIPHHPEIASSMAAIAQELLQLVEYITLDTQGDQFDLTRLTISAHPEYVALVWRMGLRSMSERDDLLVLHADSREYTGQDTRITTEQFDRAFPR